ncbi:hypothetical protein BGZ51_004748 [Haplosporangium sp. Z 767]|nr:hypothetical protein BGZ50_006755 [Haplosporangium sp. Z 11]KAF9182412.1 hypothetical protein BGZ51_004748 [Haplosporangium sp. Z 767]
MAPLRQLLASRAVIAGLVALGCLGLFISTLDNASSNDLKRVWRNNNSNNNQQAMESPIQWADAANPSRDLGKPLTTYPQRKPSTTQHKIEMAKGYYDRVVRMRHTLLKQFNYGNNFVCPHEIQRVGPLNDGGKWICGMSLYEEHPRAKCVIYSFGVNYETRFEGEMLDRTDCEIWAYDASVTSMGPEATSSRSHFYPYFIGREDKVDQNGKTWKTLKTLMKENGHDWIDILKVDIEGSEYPTFDAIMDDFDVLPFSQLQMELHVHESHVSFPDFLKWWERLESKGVYPWWTEINLNPVFSGQRAWASEYCFLNTKGGSKNLLIQNFV